MELHGEPAGSLRKLGPAEVTAWPCVEAVRALGRAVGQGGVVETKPIERSRTETNYPRISPRIQDYHKLWTLMCHSYRAYGPQLFPNYYRKRLGFHAPYFKNLEGPQGSKCDTSRFSDPLSCLRLCHATASVEW